MILVTVSAVDRAPLVSFAWLLRKPFTTVSPALSICSLLRCSGPSTSQCWVELITWVTCSTSSGTPSMNWSTTKLSSAASTARPPSSSRNTASPRCTPCRDSQSTPGNSRADIIIAIATGTTITSRRRMISSTTNAAAKSTSKRQAHAAAWRTVGCTDSSALADIPVA